jgi:predicted ATPase
MGDAITSLTIKGFKSIRSLEDFKLEPLNVLIGANGAGKSNFVSFFSLLRSIVNQRLQLALAERGGADAHLFLGPRITREIVAKLYFGRNGYEFALVPTSDNRLIFSDEAAYFAGDSSDFGKHFGKGHSESRLAEATKQSGGTVPSFVYVALSGWTVYHFHDTSETAGVRRTGTTRDYERLQPDASNLAAFLTRLQERHAREYELIRDTVRLVAPFFDDFKLRPQPNGGEGCSKAVARHMNRSVPSDNWLGWNG